MPFGLIAETVNKITEKEVEQYKNEKLFIIRYSNIIYEKNGKNIKIPIFQGNHGDVLYKDFYDYCIQKKYFPIKKEYKYIESGFIIKAKKGELRKTFHKFLDFYKSNILKDIDINKPAKMDCDGYEWWIDYDFIVDDVPCYIRIRIDSSEEDNNNYRKYKSPYEIRTLEKSSCHTT